MFISLFDYLCLKDCHPPELQWCWNESRLVKLLSFCLLSRKFGQSFFVGVSFVSFDKQAKFVSQQMRNCVCKTRTATTGTRPPLVASQYLFYKMSQYLTADNLASLVPPSFESSTSYRLRDASNIRHATTRTQLYYKFFLPSSIRSWNELSPEIRDSNSVQSFRYQLDSK